MTTQQEARRQKRILRLLVTEYGCPGRDFHESL